MDFEIRAAISSDVREMQRIRGSVRENRLSDPRRISDASYVPFIAAGSAWVAETGGRILGFAAIDPSDGSVWALFVDPAAEGAGIGRALHGRMVEWARVQGLPRLTLLTEGGTRAAQFYRRAGWRETGRAEDGQSIFELDLPT